MKLLLVFLISVPLLPTVFAEDAREVNRTLNEYADQGKMLIPAYCENRAVVKECSRNQEFLPLQGLSDDAETWSNISAVINNHLQNPGDLKKRLLNLSLSRIIGVKAKYQNLFPKISKGSGLLPDKKATKQCVKASLGEEELKKLSKERFESKLDFLGQSIVDALHAKALWKKYENVKKEYDRKVFDMQYALATPPSQRPGYKEYFEQEKARLGVKTVRSEYTKLRIQSAFRKFNDQEIYDKMMPKIRPLIDEIKKYEVIIHKSPMIYDGGKDAKPSSFTNRVQQYLNAIKTVQVTEGAEVKSVSGIDFYNKSLKILRQEPLDPNLLTGLKEVLVSNVLPKNPEVVRALTNTASRKAKEITKDLDKGLEEICENKGEKLHHHQTLVNEFLAQHLEQAKKDGKDLEAAAIQVQSLHCSLLDETPLEDLGIYYGIGLAGSALGAGLLLMSGPIGWGVLGFSSLGLAVTGTVDAIDKYGQYTTSKALVPTELATPKEAEQAFYDLMFTSGFAVVGVAGSVGSIPSGVAKVVKSISAITKSRVASTAQKAQQSPGLKQRLNHRLEHGHVKLKRTSQGKYRFEVGVEHAGASLEVILKKLSAAKTVSEQKKYFLMLEKLKVKFNSMDSFFAPNGVFNPARLFDAGHLFKDARTQMNAIIHSLEKTIRNSPNNSMAKNAAIKSLIGFVRTNASSSRIEGAEAVLRLMKDKQLTIPTAVSRRLSGFIQEAKNAKTTTEQMNKTKYLDSPPDFSKPLSAEMKEMFRKSGGDQVVVDSKTAAEMISSIRHEFRLAIPEKKAEILEYLKNIKVEFRVGGKAQTLPSGKGPVDFKLDELQAATLDNRHAIAEMNSVADGMYKVITSGSDVNLKVKAAEALASFVRTNTNHYAQSGIFPRGVETLRDLYSNTSLPREIRLGLYKELIQAKAGHKGILEGMTLTHP